MALYNVMKDVIYLLFHLLTTLAKLISSGGSRTVIAEKLFVHNADVCFSGILRLSA
jgi:hypothetical protein